MYIYNIVCSNFVLDAEQILPNGFFDAEIKGVGNQGVADAHLVKSGQGMMEKCQVLQTQIVPCIHAEPKFAAVCGSLY